MSTHSGTLTRCEWLCSSRWYRLVRQVTSWEMSSSCSFCFSPCWSNISHAIGMLSRSTAHTKGKREAVSWRAAACPSTGPTGFKPPRVQSALELDAAEGRRREGDFAPGINNVSHYSSLSFIESTKGQEERGERCVNSEEQVNMSTEGNRKSTNWTFTLLNRKEESKKIRICRL